MPLKSGLLCFYLAAAFLIFGASLKYPFVYDDYAKIVDNRSLLDVHHLVRTFFDPGNQSDDPTLSRHTFRPLFVLLIGVEHRLFGDNAIGFRAINIFFHGLNAFLVACLAASLFGVPWSAAVIAGLSFLIHPAQVESVVWVVEQSNVLCASLILGALLFWVRYLRVQKRRDLFWSSSCFVLGLFIRENAFVFPVAATAVAFYFYRTEKIGRGASKSLLILFLISMTAFLYRSELLNRTAQSTAFSFSSQAAVILSAFIASLKMTVFPFPITINHLYVGTPGWTWWLLLMGIAVLGIYRKNERLLLCVALYGIFWFPTSHVIPIAAFFAERFLYMPLVAVALLQGLLWEWPQTRGQKIAVKVALLVFNLVLLGLTLKAIPVWKDDISLWNHAAQTTPKNWRVWYNLAASEKIERGPTYINDPMVLNRIKIDLMTALQCSLPTNYADDVFLELAKTNYLLGEKNDAEEHARRAAVLNPSAADEWIRIKASLTAPTTP